MSRWKKFNANRRARRSLYALYFVIFISLFANFIANDQPLIVKANQRFFFPVLFEYVETDFGGHFKTPVDYHSNYFSQLIKNSNGWMVWPPIPFSYATHDFKLKQPAPAPPSWKHWLGTNDRNQDVLANLIYGVRISLLFGVILTLLTTLFGVYLGAIQGYYGGKIDLYGQRFIEIWTGLPSLYILIILSSFFSPGFWTLILVMFIFGWPSLVSVVRAEFLKGRGLDYVTAAKVMGVSNNRIMFKYILPNAMVATLTLLPFILTENIAALAALDFLGFGLPAGSPSLGALISQSKSNLHAPWMGLSVFFTMSTLLTLLIFVGEGVRDAFDPRV